MHSAQDRSGVNPRPPSGDVSTVAAGSLSVANVICSGRNLRLLKASGKLTAQRQQTLKHARRTQTPKTPLRKRLLSRRRDTGRRKLSRKKPKVTTGRTTTAATPLKHWSSRKQQLLMAGNGAPIMGRDIALFRTSSQVSRKNLAHDTLTDSAQGKIYYHFEDNTVEWAN